MTGQAGDRETIAAIATAVGGAVAILRLSGADALAIAESCWRGSPPLHRQPPRRLCLGEILDPEGQAIDRALAVRFPAPASYTGEDMVEIHCHGGGLVARTILLHLLEAGARGAEPGEFTKRAFVNGKMDLTQAEAVADIVEAHSLMALRLGKRQLEGALGRRISTIYDRLTTALADLESQLDFPEEEIEPASKSELAATLAESAKQIDRLQASKLEGEILRHGIRLVLAGPPNVGKSSLMNAILGRDRAIVTNLPGTTRDTLEEFAHIRGIPVRLIDTAGLRQARDEVETFGIERTLAEMKEAQVVLWISSAEPAAEERDLPPDLARCPTVRVENKCDLKPDETGGEGIVRVSALTGAGLDELFDAIEKTVWRQPHAEEPEVAVAARHANLLKTALPALRDAAECIEREQLELAAVSLRTAIDAIGRIHGRTVMPDVLDRIFSRFCLGK